MIESTIPISILIWFAVVFIVGIIVTIYLWFSGDRIHQKKQKDLDEFNKISFIKLSVDALILIYLFRVTLMFITDVFSRGYMTSLMGLILALIPVILVLLSNYKKRQISKSKEAV